MDPATIAALVGTVADQIKTQYQIGFELLFGDEKRRKAAALEDSTRINPWFTPKQYTTDNSFLMGLAILAVTFIVLLLAFVLTRKK